MSKFFVNNCQIQNEMITIKGEDVNHIANVLRLQKQDKIFICDRDEETTYQTEIVKITKDEVECKIIKKITNTNESVIQVTIFQGLPKSDKMEYIIQKTTELGVKAVLPVSMKRCVVKLEGKDASKKLERWQKIAEVAAKQSGRDMIPKIEDVMKFEKVKEVVSDFDLFLVAYEGEKRNTLKRVLSDIHINRIKKEIAKEKEIKLEERLYTPLIKEELKIGVMIGPEGGIESEEVEQLKNLGAKVVTLGKRILRTETAPIAILSNIMYEFEG